MAVDPFFVSVIIPVYNAKRFLLEAVESVRQQDYQPMEIIIVDDGSTDSSAALINNLGDDIRFFSQEHQGPSAARNQGLAMARGDVIAFLDADDLWPRGRLHLQLERLLQDPNLEVVMGRTQYFGLLSVLRGKIQFEGTDNTAIVMHLGSALFRKSTFEKVGNFDESLPNYEDLDWFLRAREKGVSMLILKIITQRYRMHEGNYSRTQSSVQGMMRVLKKSVIRRKSNPQQAQLPKFHDFDEARMPFQPTGKGFG